MSKTVPRRAVNGLFGMFDGKRTQNVFSAVASKSNVFRLPASDGFVTSGSVEDFTRPELRGTPGRHHIFTAVREVLTTKRVQLPSVGINGFDQIGRCLLRLALKDYVHVVAINESSLDIETMARLLREDMANDVFSMKVNIKEEYLCVDDRLIRVSHERYPEKISWKNLRAEYVIDTTENCTDRSTIMKHITPCGAKKVILTTRSQDFPVFFKGVNYEKYKKSMSVVATGSSSVICTISLINLMEKNFKITTCWVQSKTPDTGIIYQPNDERSIYEKIVLGKTNIIKNTGALHELISYSKTHNDVSYLEVHFRLDSETCLNKIKSQIDRGIMSYNSVITRYENSKEPAVEMLAKDRHSTIIDTNRIVVHDNDVRIGAWYNRITGVAARTLDILKHMIYVDQKT